MGGYKTFVSGAFQLAVWKRVVHSDYRTCLLYTAVNLSIYFFEFSLKDGVLDLAVLLFDHMILFHGCFSNNAAITEKLLNFIDFVIANEFMFR